MSNNTKQDEGTLNDVLQLKKQVAYGVISRLPKLPAFKKDIVAIIQNYDRVLNELPPIDEFERQFGGFSQSSYLKCKKDELEQRYQVMDDCVFEPNEMLKDRKKALSKITENTTTPATATKSSLSTLCNIPTSQTTLPTSSSQILFDIVLEKTSGTKRKKQHLFVPSPDK